MRTLNLHAVFLFEGGQTQRDWLKRQLDGANAVFAPARLEFSMAGSEVQPFKEGICEIGACDPTRAGTAHQEALFARVDAELPLDEPVVFVAKGLLPNSADGCAWHPPGRPGCVVAARDNLSDPQYKLAHELGHVLGLQHNISNSRLLMFPSVGWTKLPPELSDDDLARLSGDVLPAQPATEVMVETDADTRPFDLQFELERAEPDLDRLSLRGDTLVPDLIEVCRGNADVQVQARALSVLLRLRAAGIDELLAAAVRSPDLPVRIAVAYHLKLLGGSAGGNYLEQLRGDADAAVRALVTH